MATLSITRALNELKLLDARIDRAIKEAKFIAVQTGKKLIEGHITNEKFAELAKASVDSINKLISRRDVIKSKIVISNATTPVKFPNGDEMTVAEAIERKTSIMYPKSYLNQLRSQYNVSIMTLNRENDKAKVNLDKRIETILGKDAKDKSSEVDSITKSFNAEYESHLIDPLKLKDVIDALTKDIEDFENEVDFVLSESNTRTDIEVED